MRLILPLVLFLIVSTNSFSQELSENDLYVRTVMQGMQARDFYDIWYLLEIHGMEIDFYINEFKSKCESKGQNPFDFHIN